MRKIKKTIRKVVDTCIEETKCDVCGKEARDSGTSGPVDWTRRIKEDSCGLDPYDPAYNYDRLEKEVVDTTCCWAIDAETDENFEVIICLDCFKTVLKKYINKVDE